jgi:peptide/nickel transport system ATP-binding protein
MKVALLEVSDLSVIYQTDEGTVYALDNVSLSVRKGEIVSVVGESGSGKSTLANTVIKLLPPYAKVINGRVLFEDKDVLSLSEEDMREIRGNRISMIFQEPNIALNPLFKIKEFMTDVYLAHNPGATKDEALARSLEMLREARVPTPEDVLERYPHELSGGMKQRVLIATSLLNNPDLLIADEPTSALDVSVQAQIISLLRKLQREKNMSVIFITHDLAVAAQIADRIVVMYAGHVLEEGSVDEVFKDPLHPYTKMLMKSVPKIGAKKIESPPGSIPDLRRRIDHCVFMDRCPKAFEKCKEKPPLISLGDRKVACWLYSER